MKRIVVCCDGTWNRPGNKDRGQRVETNVEKIYKAVESESSGIPQIKFYGPGVGTGFAITDQLLGGGTGMGIDRNIQDAYKFLMWSYEPGDELYLYGFSRGAYTVRSLAGLIRNCGIMKPNYMHLIPDAYQLYRDRTELTHPDSDPMKAYKRSYSIEPETKIKLMGVWDTVGALGIPLPWFAWWNRKYLFHDVKLGSHVKYAYHALALDERRRIFMPALWEVNKNALQDEGQICEQVWFPGVHGNVGGGYLDCGLSNIALKWMMDKSAEAGLEFNEAYKQQLICDSKGEMRDSCNMFYKLTGTVIRGINDLADNGEPKVVARNEKIHYSCLERFHLVPNYRPRNLSPALARGTDFDPVRDKWRPEWKEYLSNFTRSVIEKGRKVLKEKLT